MATFGFFSGKPFNKLCMWVEMSFFSPTNTAEGYNMQTRLQMTLLPNHISELLLPYIYKLKYLYNPTKVKHNDLKIML